MEESEKCALFDCEAAATKGSIFCWAHEQQRLKGTLKVAPSSLRWPHRPHGPQICLESRCREVVVPASNYCRYHGRG